MAGAMSAMAMTALFMTGCDMQVGGGRVWWRVCVAFVTSVGGSCLFEEQLAHRGASPMRIGLGLGRELRR